MIIVEPPTLCIINPMGYSRWSTKEIALLKKLYPSLRVRELSKRFPRRNKATIVAKAVSLNLPSAKIWQPEENGILKKYFYNCSKEEILKLLPKRTWPAVLAQGERLALRRKTDKPKLDINESYFKKWSPNMAYVVGFILADGCIIKGTYKGYSDSLKFGVQTQDRDILEKIKYELKSKHKLSVTKTKNAVSFSISSQKIVDDLKNLGIIYRKSLKEIVPTVPTKYVKDFIRGVVDGDGSIQLDKRNYPALSVAGGENTLRFIRDHFFTKFKLYSGLYKGTYSKNAQKYLYGINYRTNSAKTLINYLYTNSKLYLNRKYATALRCLNVNIKTRNNMKYRLKQHHESYTG